MSEVVDGKVHCPRCNTHFDVIQHRSYGSSAARLWNTVPKFHRGFISWWYSWQLAISDAVSWYTKVDIHSIFCKKTGNTINLNNFGDRLSGIKGMRYQIVDVKKGTKSEYNNSVADYYRLDLAKTANLMNHEWNIIKTLEEI